MITLNGVFYRRGIADDRVVFVAADDHARMQQWWTENNLFTQIFHHPHPTTQISTPTIYFAESFVGQLQEGNEVNITVDVRPEKRGNGLKIISVLPALANP